MAGDASPGGVSDGGDDWLALKHAATVAEFLRGRQQLSLDQCLTIVGEAIRLLETLYVHLPLKRAMYAVDPVRRLRLLQLRLERFRELKHRLDDRGSLLPGEQEPPPDDLWFHREMSDTLTSVRDLHTMYVLPEPFDRAIAFVPFQVEDYFVGSERRFTVSNVVTGLDWFAPPPDFVPGVEVTHWNGIPIPRAVELAGQQNAGSNPDARLARGLSRLTIRPLAKSLPPDEEWVTVNYTRESGEDGEGLRVPWRVARLPAEPDAPAGAVTLRQAMGEGLDHETDIIRLLRGEMYRSRGRDAAGRQVLRGRDRAEPRRASRIENLRALEGVPEYFEAKTFAVDGVDYGYVRIRSFKVANDGEFLNSFIALVERKEMPANGLILDVRDNPGGYIPTGERLLQVLTPNTIEPERLQFVNSASSLLLCDRVPEYWPWRESIERAMETSTTFSSSIPLTEAGRCNDEGQRYYGPVVLITNALCYSTTDIFAAGFQDHKIGTVLGTHGSTGAGGANVITHSKLRARYESLRAAAADMKNDPVRWPLGTDPLPLGADLRIAIRRTLRVGERSGTELEDLGVTPDALHRMTKDDVLGDNPDLLADAADLLRGKKACTLREIAVSGGEDGDVIVAEVETSGIEWLDVFVDGWASGSHSVGCGRNVIGAKRPRGGPAKLLELRGYRREGKDSTLVAARKIRLAAAAPPPASQ